MIDHLLINDNAYFYKKIKPIPTQKINQVFTEVSREKLSNRYSYKAVKNAANVGNESFYYSICIFKYNHKPSFLKEPIDDWYEVKFSFLLIVEYLDYVVIYKNNVAGLKTLNEFIEPLDYVKISRLFVIEDTKFEKFYLSNMSTADNALRNRTVEGNNLQGTISRIGAPKQVIHNMRVSNDQDKTSLSLNTSRINKLGNREEMQEFFNWIVEVVRKINVFNWRNTYLDNFAQPINFEDYADELNPICILIKFDKLLDDIERERVERVYKVDDNDDEIEEFNLNTFIDHFNTTLNVNMDEEGKYYIDNPVDPEMYISVAKKSLRLNSSELKKVKIDKGEDNLTDLVNYINARSDFIVNFTEPDLIYAYRKLFRDHRLLADVEGFLSVFKPYRELTLTTSEKGGFNSSQTEFETNSIFRFICDELATDSIALFCDDLGNEWADFISVNSETITFYHAKHKEGQGLSASDLQDVIGQAHKNLGNLEPTDDMLDRKAANKWSNKYNADEIQTQIKRLQIGPYDSISEAIKEYKLALAHPNIKKQVNIVIDFISKQELSDGLELLKRNESFSRRNEVTQILWFVSSLVANCRELGIETYISCRP